MLCSALLFHCVLCRVVGYRPPGNGLLCSALFFHCAFVVGWSVIDLPGMLYDMPSNVFHFVFDLAVDRGK